MMTPRLLFLWGPPRSLSTAFLRMMLERGDYLVMHEPFSSIVAQGHVMFGGSKVKDAFELLGLLREKAERTPIFVKETTEYRYDVIDAPDFVCSATHSFITRHPRSVIASHYGMNEKVTCSEIGFEYQYEIFRAVYDRSGRLPAVIEAESLMADPSGTVRRYCREVGIPYMPSALSWEPGDREEWGRTSEWHREVANSRGFRASAGTYPVGVHNNAALSAFYDYHMPFYEKMISARLDLAG
ncbi:sulfotransferase family protein [Actinomadura nitritigenes]|uniref:sulfotransferase-like domain-containing protein n=1 Tax=Actinomadura nitritigenes TaxID=134602 RepID=UPI003D8A9432